MHIDIELTLNTDETKCLNERWERLRASLPPLKEAAEGEEPVSDVSNVMDLEDIDP